MAHLRRKLVTRLDESPRHAAAAAAITGAVAGVTEYLVHTLVTHTMLSRRAPGIVDSVIIALLAGVLVYMVLAEARARRTILLQHLRNVAELNHEVRNALQMIVYSKYLPPQARAEAVLDSVNRIETTLHDLFPGEPIPKEGAELFGQARKPPLGTTEPPSATDVPSERGERLR